MLLKVVARRLSDHCEAQGLLPEEQSGFRPGRATTGMMFEVRRLQELRRKAGRSLFLCFIDLQKAYDTVDRTLLWQVLARLGVPPQMVTVIRNFHDGLRACVRSDNGEYSGVVRGGAGTTARVCTFPTTIQHLLCCGSTRRHPELQRGRGHP